MWQNRRVSTPLPLPTDLAEAHALIRRQSEELAAAEARASGAEALIAHMKLVIAKLRREQYGQSSERGRKVLDQLELQLEELAAETSENAVTAEDKTAGVAVKSFARQRPVRAPLPAHLPRERVVIPAPCACPVCGGRLAKLGEDITETLEIVPRQWKVIQTVREKFSCRSCEKITQPPAPFHAIARARAGASLLAMILYAKFGQHQPLNRQSDVYAREGVELDVSTLADWVGACSATLAPLVELIRRHVLAADRIHGDDTTVPVLAKNRTVTGRLWTYVRDDRPFGGSDPPAAMFFYSRDRGGEHPRRHLLGWAGILQADAYAGFGELYNARRSPRPITEAACWAHGRRKFFVLADLRQVPLAIEAVRRIDEIFAVEREINGATPEQRHAVRQERIKPLVAALEGRMRTERARLSRRDLVQSRQGSQPGRLFRHLRRCAVGYGLARQGVNHAAFDGYTCGLGDVLPGPMRPTIRRLDTVPANGGSNRPHHRPGKSGITVFHTHSRHSMGPRSLSSWVDHRLIARAPERKNPARHAVQRG
jgi:transposase